MRNFLPSRYKVSGNPLATERRIELVVLLLALLLALQLIYSFLRLLFLSAPEPIIPAAESLAFSDVISVQIVSAVESNEIVARPLFWPSRRPLDAVAIVEEAIDDGKLSTELASVSLTGVFGGGESAGIIAVVDDKKHRVLVGGKLFDWTLDSMGLDHAVFVRAGKKERLELKSVVKSTKKIKRDSKKRKLRL